MEWLSCIRQTITLIESNLKTDLRVKEIAAKVGVSVFFLQKGFSVMTGYSISEYTRNRKLYQAALDLQSTDRKIIDIALDYGYETPESFTKAFSRFHGATPSQVRAGAYFKLFLPLSITIYVSGGNQMNTKIVNMFPFKVIGFQKEMTIDKADEEIPKFWDAFLEKYAANVYAGNPPVTAYEHALVNNNIGEYGICMDDLENGKVNYLIAGKYNGGDVPEGMHLYEVPGGDYAVFDCVGSLPNAIQNMNQRVYNEWLPGNPDYALCGNASIEWYDYMNTEKTNPNYRSAIWLPVKKKRSAL